MVIFIGVCVGLFVGWFASWLNVDPNPHLVAGADNYWGSGGILYLCLMPVGAVIGAFVGWLVAELFTK